MALVTPRLYAVIPVAERERGDSDRLSPDGTERIVGVKGDTPAIRGRLAAVDKEGRAREHAEMRTFKRTWDDEEMGGR